MASKLPAKWIVAFALVALFGAQVVSAVQLRRDRKHPMQRTTVLMILNNATKRILDIIGALVALALAGPVMLVVAVLVRLRLGSPILFRQDRPGLYGDIFTIYKFRTMTSDRDASGNLLPDEKRLTGFGKLLRSLSLDELPELLNVLKGDMSLIGPRPLRTVYLQRYSHEQARRHLVKPGITGWAQINGRNGIDWDQKFALDLWYVDHWTIWLDLKILVLTIWKVLRREGISQEGHATMPEFMGMGTQGEQQI